MQTSLRMGLSAVMFTALLVGCGGGDEEPETATVSGTVTYKGKAVEGAKVTFVVGGNPSIGMTKPDGTFTIKEVPVGTATIYIVKISAAKVDSSQMKPEDMAKMATAAKTVENAMSDTVGKNELPKKYAAASTSGLRKDVSVDEESNVFKFDLK